MARLFPSGIAVAFGILAIFLSLFFSNTISSHQPLKEDKAMIDEMFSLIDEENPPNVLIEFSIIKEEEGGYNAFHVLKITEKNLYKIPCIVVRNLRTCNRKEFRMVSKKIVEIFKKASVAVKPRRIIDFNPGFIQTIEIRQKEVEPWQYKKIFQNYIKFFYLDGWELSIKDPDF